MVLTMKNTRRIVRKRKKMMVVSSLSSMTMMMIMMMLNVVESNSSRNNNNNNYYRPSHRYLSIHSVPRMNPRERRNHHHYQSNNNNNNNDYYYDEDGDEDWSRRQGSSLRGGGGGRVKQVKQQQQHQLQQQQQQQPEEQRLETKPIFGDLDALEHVRRWNLGQSQKRKKLRRKNNTKNQIGGKRRRKKKQPPRGILHNHNSNNHKQLPHPSLEEPEFPSTVLVSYNEDDRSIQDVSTNSIDPSPTVLSSISNTPTSMTPSSTLVMTTSSSSSSVLEEDASSNTVEEEEEVKNTAPVVYRYFGRSRAKRTLGRSHIPFIILGPSVDHWKDTGKLLASRGFNVMACQRMADTDTYVDSTGDELVLSVLDALRWNRAILVGCDQDSLLAIQAAQRLAPDRIAGLILCGDLQPTTQNLIASTTPHTHAHNQVDAKSLVWLDAYLDDTLDCPTTIISDGHHLPSNNLIEQQYMHKRTVIVGGGNTPFLRLPEQFAWTLSRFVEQQLNDDTNNHQDNIQDVNDDDAEIDIDIDINTSDETLDQHLSQFLNNNNNSFTDKREPTTTKRDWKKQLKAIQQMIPPAIRDPFEQIFTPGSLLVSGRVIATAMIYISFAKVLLYQYQGIRNIHSSYLRLSVWRQQLQRINKFKRNLFLLLTHRKLLSTTNSDQAIINTPTTTEQLSTSQDSTTTIQDDQQLDIIDMESTNTLEQQQQDKDSNSQQEPSTLEDKAKQDEGKQEEETNQEPNKKQKQPSNTHNFRQFTFLDHVIS